MPESAVPSERPLRRDAERNRQRILQAARVVFAERGLGGSHDDIAREAGVGVGTVYRRFHDKQQLIDALFEARIEEIADVARAAAEHPDPWEALVGFLLRTQELVSKDRGLKEIVLGGARGAERAVAARSRIAQKRCGKPPESCGPREKSMRGPWPSRWENRSSRVRRR